MRVGKGKQNVEQTLREIVELDVNALFWKLGKQNACATRKSFEHAKMQEMSVCLHIKCTRQCRLHVCKSAVNLLPSENSTKQLNIKFYINSSSVEFAKGFVM